MFRSLTRTKPRRLPGVTCCSSRTRNRSWSILTSMPFFRRVACKVAILSVSGTPNRSTCYDLAMAFARWDPLGDLLAMQQQLDRVSPSPSGWIPPVDLFENADRYVLTAEIPGLRREDVHIQVHD